MLSSYISMNAAFLSFFHFAMRVAPGVSAAFNASVVRRRERMAPRTIVIAEIPLELTLR